MADLIRDTAAGYFIRLLSGRKILRFPEEIPGFVPPFLVSVQPETVVERQEHTPNLTREVPNDDDDFDEKTEVDRTPDTFEPGSQRVSLAGSDRIDQADLDNALQNVRSQIIHPVQTEDGIILVDWYSLDDPANPYNWSGAKKTLVCGEICSLTFAIYVGSSAFTPSIPGVSEQFGVSEVVASLGLALYVVAYGLGPLLWSPLSEIPAVGRNGLYIGTLFISVLLMIPAALTNNLAGFFVLRFLIGFFSSPSLSTGPASFGDVMEFRKLPYVVTLWSSSAYLAPAVGPLIGGYAVEAKNWHWSLLELLWLCSPLWVFLFFFLPETSSDNILLRRAARLRKLTGNPNYKSQSEIKQANMSAKTITFNALVKPWQLNALDPAILFSTVYVSLAYSIFYTFFEAFPLVFPVMHGFGLGETGLAFIAVPIGLMIAIPAQLLHYYFVAEPFLIKNGQPAPEYWLRPALIGNIFGPIGLFIFAWTSSPLIHWAVPLLGVAIFQGGSYHISNGLFTYIPRIYPTYAASLFAANAAARSLLAGAAVLFARPMYLALGIGGGVSLLAGLMCICSVFMYLLYFFGPALRRRSRFVVD